MHIADFSTKNPVLVNLIMVAILVIGFITALRLPLELFPSIQLEMVTVTTVYPGASAEDVEQLVSIPVEDEINNISGIEVVRSVSSEGRSFVIAEVEPGEDTQTLAQDISSKLSIIEDKLPEDAEEPIVEEVKSSFPLINVAIAGEVSREILRNYALQLRDELKLIRGVDSLITSGMGDPVFWVRLNPKKMRQHGVSLVQAEAAVRQKNTDLPAGAVSQNQVEYLVRTRGRVQETEDLLSIPVRESRDGRHVLLRDVASVELGEEEARTKARVNGLPSISFWVNKQKDVDAIETVALIREKIYEFDKRIPENMKVFATNDTSYWVEQRFDTMIKSGAIGLAIVLIILACFLNLRAAAIAALGIPVSFLGAVILMQLSGITLTVISMFGLILVLGIVVDDAIIVVENIQRYLQSGVSPLKAAVQGTKEVALPVIATILTNIAAFIPLMAATGLIGKFLAIIPKVAIFALVVSLVEALLIMPSHCADFLKPKTGKKAVRKWVYKMRYYYLKALSFALRNRYVVVGSFTLIFALSLTVLKEIPLVLFYTKDIAQFNIKVENPTRSSLEATRESVREIEDLIRAEIPDHVLKNITSMIGIDISTGRQPDFGDHLATIIVEYEDFEKREENGVELMNDVRRQVDRQITGAARVDFIRSEGPPTGKPVEVRIQGRDFDTLREITKEAEIYLGKIPGVYGISNDLSWGKPEIRVEIDERRAAVWNLDTTSVAREIRAAADGLTVAQTRLGNEEADIVLKFDLPSGNITSLLRSYQIKAPGGDWVPLDTIAHMHVEPSMLNINRYNLERAARITAEVDQNVTTALQVNSGLGNFLDTRLDGYPGYSHSFGGEEQELEETLADIKRASIIAVLLIYTILASILKSYTQPLIIMSVLPFTIIGVAVGILLRGEPFSIPAIIGTVALLGIVVNDSLVLMDFINKRRERMSNRVMAVFLSAKHRFRPIVLTTVTTFGGLASLMVQTRGEAAFLAPMAIALGFGLVFATLIVLYLIPSLYLILDDLKTVMEYRIDTWRGKKVTQFEVVSELGLTNRESKKTGSEKE